MPNQVEKKRQRSDDASSAKKALAVDKIGKPVRLERAMKEAPKWMPAVDTSIGFNIPSNVPFHAYSKAASKKKDSKTETLLHANAHPIMSYTAKEDRSSMVNCGVNHFVGIFDPATSSVKFVQVNKMQLRGVIKARRPTTSDTPAERLRGMAQRIELNKAFGTRKAKKAIDDVMLNALPTTAQAGADTKLSAAELATLAAIKENSSTMATREELDAAASSSKPIPRPNLEATEIQDVYRADYIIGREVLLSIPIKDWMDSVSANENVQLRSRFVAGRLVRIANSADAVTRLRLLRFLYYLIMYINMGKKTRDGRKVPPRAVFTEKVGAPEMVTSYLFKTFTLSGVMDKFHHQLAMTHAAAWAITLENYEMDTTDLRFDLGQDPAGMDQIFREIGARPKQYKNPQSKQTSTMAKLALPLQFPKMRRMAARK